MLYINTHMYVFLPVYVGVLCVGVCLWSPEEGGRSPGAGVTERLSGQIGVRNWTQAFSKNSTHSWPLSRPLMCTLLSLHLYICVSLWLLWINGMVDRTIPWESNRLLWAIIVLSVSVSTLCEVCYRLCHPGQRGQPGFSSWWTVVVSMGLLPAEVLCCAHSFWPMGHVPANLGAVLHLCLQRRATLVSAWILLLQADFVNSVQSPVCHHNTW